jgi:hypothetical protein
LLVLNILLKANLRVWTKEKTSVFGFHHNFLLVNILGVFLCPITLRFTLKRIFNFSAQDNEISVKRLFNFSARSLRFYLKWIFYHFSIHRYKRKRLSTFATSVQKIKLPWTNGYMVVAFSSGLCGQDYGV